MAVKNIIFDFGGVLLDWNPHYLFDPYFGSVEKAEWFIKNVCTSAWNAEMDKGKPFDVAVAERIALFPEWEKEIRLYQSDWIKMIGEEIPGMYKLECDLKEAGYRLYGLTNWSLETFDLVRSKRVFAILDGMVVSGEEHLLKPDAAIFHRLLDRYGLKPEECLFTDDNMPNVIGAQAVGISAVQFTGCAALRNYIALHDTSGPIA